MARRAPKSVPEPAASRATTMRLLDNFERPHEGVAGPIESLSLVFQSVPSGRIELSPKACPRSGSSTIRARFWPAHSFVPVAVVTERDTSSTPQRGSNPACTRCSSDSASRSTFARTYPVHPSTWISPPRRMAPGFSWMPRSSRRIMQALAVAHQGVRATQVRHLPAGEFSRLIRTGRRCTISVYPEDVAVSPIANSF